VPSRAIVTHLVTRSLAVSTGGACGVSFRQMLVGFSAVRYSYSMSKSLMRSTEVLFFGIPVFLATAWCGLLIALPHVYRRSQAQTVSLYTIFAQPVGMIFLIFIIVYFGNRVRLWVLGIGFLATFSTIVTAFSVFYWQLGYPPNFNIELSILDAVYFAVGTLSTAGTGNIVATSEAVRAIQTVQMIVDFGLILLVAGIFVARLTSSSNQISSSDP
jgi:Ion channel